MKHLFNLIIFVLLCWISTGCQQYDHPKVINLDLSQIQDPIHFSKVFEIEQVIPIEWSGLPENSYKVKVAMFSETFYWYGETIDEPFLFLFNSDGSFLSRIEQFSTILDICQANDRLEVLEIASLHSLNPVGSVIQTYDFEEPIKRGGFWQLKAGNFSSRTLHQDTVFEMRGNNKRVPRFLLDWDVDGFKGDLSGRTRFYGDITVGGNLLFCDGGISNSEVNFIYDTSSNQTLLFGSIIGLNSDVIGIPVAGIYEDKLVLFIRKAEIPMFIENSADHEEFDCLLLVSWKMKRSS
jgi:hypothetical protein